MSSVSAADSDAARTASTFDTGAARTGQHMGRVLNWEDHFVQRWCCFTRRRVWVIKSRRVSWIGTALNLYVLLNALRALHALSQFTADDYAISSLSQSASCVADRVVIVSAVNATHANASSTADAGSLFGVFAASVLELRDHVMHGAEGTSSQMDYTSVMAACQVQLNRAESPGLYSSKLAYWWLAHGFITLAASSDLLRWCGCSWTISDSLLAYRSPRIERLRFRPFYLMLIPFFHLSWLHARPVEVPCCIGTPHTAVVVDRIRLLAWLCLLAGYCLLNDSANNGYVLLRAPDSCRSAVALLRASRASADPLLEDEQETLYGDSGRRHAKPKAGV